MRRGDVGRAFGVRDGSCEAQDFVVGTVLLDRSACCVLRRTEPVAACVRRECVREAFSSLCRADAPLRDVIDVVSFFDVPQGLF
jgi:hypothetical protein